MSDLHEAIAAADAGFKEGLRGQYPAAAKLLADECRRIFSVVECALASWDDENDVPIHEAMAAMRAVVKPNVRAKRGGTVLRDDSA